MQNDLSSSSESSPNEGEDSFSLDENNNSVDIEELAPQSNNNHIEEQVRPDIKESQESTRSTLAIVLFIAYILTTLSALGIATWAKIDTKDRKEIVLLIVTSQVTLMGSALGFYFGKSS